MNEDVVKVTLPTDEWRKMEDNHELVEDFKLNKETYGYEEAKNILLEELNQLLKED